MMDVECLFNLWHGMIHSFDENGVMCLGGDGWVCLHSPPNHVNVDPMHWRSVRHACECKAGRALQCTHRVGLAPLGELGPDELQGLHLSVVVVDDGWLQSVPLSRVCRHVYKYITCHQQPRPMYTCAHTHEKKAAARRINHLVLEEGAVRLGALHLEHGRLVQHWLHLLGGY